MFLPWAQLAHFSIAHFSIVMSGFCEGFRMTAHRDDAAGTGAARGRWGDDVARCGDLDVAIRPDEVGGGANLDWSGGKYFQGVRR
jgi:hypothetical protein